VHGQEILGLRVVGGLSALRSLPHQAVVVALGDNARRRALSAQLIALGESIAIARHPTSSIARGVRIGSGTMISAGVIVTVDAQIGQGVLLNTGCSVDHQSVVGDYAHVAPGATLGARVDLGEEVLVGLGARLISGVRVGARAVIGPGTVVLADLPAGSVVSHRQ
jgi:sugar O-acyltransferase (sialic acid O-acetyltransferase NeuD family)